MFVGFSIPAMYSMSNMPTILSLLTESPCRVPPLRLGMLPQCLGIKDNQTVWLFNITADPLEEWDLSEMYPDVVNRLLNRLNEYYQDSVPVLYPMPDLRSNPRLHGGVWASWE